MAGCPTWARICMNHHACERPAARTAGLPGHQYATIGPLRQVDAFRLKSADRPGLRGPGSGGRRHKWRQSGTTSRKLGRTVIWQICVLCAVQATISACTAMSCKREGTYQRRLVKRKVLALALVCRKREYQGRLRLIAQKLDSTAAKLRPDQEQRQQKQSPVRRHPAVGTAGERSRAIRRTLGDGPCARQGMTAERQYPRLCSLSTTVLFHLGAAFRKTCGQVNSRERLHDLQCDVRTGKCRACLYIRMD